MTTENPESEEIVVEDVSDPQPRKDKVPLFKSEEVKGPYANDPIPDEDDEDNAPITVDEFREAGKEVVERVRDGVLVPVWRLSRRYIRGAQQAADSFFQGALDEQEKKKGKGD